MSDIAIPGFSSESNTAKQIDNLMKAKRIPLEKMEIKQEEYTDLKTIWQDLNVTLNRLSESARKLYGFENPFNEKSVNSSNENILTAESKRNALDENLSFRVNKIATSDKFVSYQLQKDTSIPGGTYSFTTGENKTTLKYRGGTLDDFVSKLNKKNPEEIHASIIKNSASTQVLVIESLKTGEANSLSFNDDSIQMGMDLGLIQKNNIENNKIVADDLISSNGLVTKSKYELTLSPQSQASFRVNSKFSENDIYEITVELINSPKGKEKKIPLDDLQVPSVTLEDITIQSETGGGLDRFYPDEISDNPPILDMNILSISDGKYISKIAPITNDNNKKQIITISGKDINDLKSVNLTNNNSEKTLKMHSMIQKKGANRGEYIPISPITIADNAKISMNGMDIERETNEIDDLIDGTTLYLHNADKDEEVTLKIDFDTDYAKDQILDFVYNYNESVKKILLLTNDDKAIISEIEFADDKSKEKAEEIQGILKGDRTLSSIKQSLLRGITNAYPTQNDKDFALLKSIGISTNANSSGGVNASQLRGYIEANLDELDTALKNNIEGVKKLFGNDTNDDFIIDTGVAKIVDDIIKPYTRSGGSISARISTIDSQIKRNDKQITDYKDDLISYEDTIRRKYGQMDATINSLNSSMKAIENLTNTGDN